MDKRLWVVVFICGCSGLLTSGDDREIKSLIDRSVETVMKCYNIPGLSLTVLSEAKPWYTQVYNKKIKLTDKVTRFRQFLLILFTCIYQNGITI